MADANGFPITNMQAACASMHELYLSYLGAGFTEPQAMQLLCAHISTMTGGES